MKRVLCLSLSATLVLALGCNTASYNNRLNKTLDDMRYRQRLDQYLNPPAQDKLKELGVFLRPPKPLDLSTQFLLPSTPGMYDLEASFADRGGGPAAPRLHVVARRKTANRPTPKGAPPPPDTSMRGDFKQDVVNLLARDFGLGGEDVNKIQDTTAKKNAYKRLIFVSPISGDTIRTYFYSRDGYDVALIWDIPRGAEKEAAASTGSELTMESFAVGPRAERMFQGALGDEEMPAGAEGAGAPNVF